MKESYDYEAMRLFGAQWSTKKMEHARRAGLIVVVVVVMWCGDDDDDDDGILGGR